MTTTSTRHGMLTSRISRMNDCGSPWSRASSGDRRAQQPCLRCPGSPPALTRTWPSFACSEARMPEPTWDSVVGQFHRMVLVTPRTAVDPSSAERRPAMHPRVVIWLHRHGAGHPWSDQLALAAAVMLARRLDLATVLGYLRTVQTFFEGPLSTPRHHVDGCVGCRPRHAGIAQM